MCRAVGVEVGGPERLRPEIRRPKAESRKKAEARNPNPVCKGGEANRSAPAERQGVVNVIVGPPRAVRRKDRQREPQPGQRQPRQAWVPPRRSGQQSE
jgi:hypothetical protein